MTESSIYRMLKYYNDAKAVYKGRVPRRIGRRVYGKVAGRLAAKLFG